VVVSLIGEFFTELAQMIVRDGLISAMKWAFSLKEAQPVDRERDAILAKRKKDRLNRRSRR
jgi:hypothetical protein